MISQLEVCAQTGELPCPSSWKHGCCRSAESGTKHHDEVVVLGLGLRVRGFYLLGCLLSGNIGVSTFSGRIAMALF